VACLGYTEGMTAYYPNADSGQSPQQLSKQQQHPVRDFFLGEILSRHGRFYFCALLLTLLLRFSLVHWALSGGFPVETVMANILCAVFSGILLGLIEGRVTAAHQERQQVLGIELTLFVNRFRLSAVSGVFSALVLSTLLELGAIVGALSDASTVIWAIGMTLLAIAVGLVTLWFAFCWARWCFGEARWN